MDQLKGFLLAMQEEGQANVAELNNQLTVLRDEAAASDTR